MKQGTENELKSESEKLSMAYNRVFELKSPFVQDVLEDLAAFCRATESAFHQDPRVHAVLEGRREVWLRIQERLQLSFEEVYRYHVIRRADHNRSSR